MTKKAKNLNSNSYNLFITEYQLYITRSEYFKYLRIIFRVVVKWIVDGHMFKLPNDLGVMYINKENAIEAFNNENSDRPYIMNKTATKKLREEREGKQSDFYWKLPPNKHRLVITMPSENFYNITHTSSPDERYLHSIPSIYSITFSEILTRLLKVNIHNFKKTPSYYEKI